MKSWNRKLLGIVSISGLVAGCLAGGLSCGRPDDAKIDPSLQGGSNYTPVNGLSGFGTQCPYGTISGVTPLRLQMWNCPIGAGTIVLNHDLPPLFLQADCKARVLTVRTADRSIDSSWYFLPDGEFDVVVDGVTAQLQTDGSGTSNCNAPLDVNIFGTVHCGKTDANLDKATIDFESVMWAGKKLNSHGNSPMVPPSPRPDGLPPPVTEHASVQNRCKLPSSCYFYTTSSLKQCL